MAGSEPYGGLFGAFPYAFRRSGSLLFRSYVVVSGLLGVFVALMLALGAISWMADPGLFGEKALLGVIGVFVLLPLFAPVLVVARRYRLDRASVAAEKLLASSGYLFVAGLYLGLLISDPESHSGPGPIDVVFGFLDSLPASYGLLPPVIAAFGIYVAVRQTSSASGN